MVAKQIVKIGGTDFALFFVSKGAFTHPVSSCVFHIVLQFFYYLTWLCKTKVNYKKLQRNVVNACGNQICKLRFSVPITLHIWLPWLILICFNISYFSVNQCHSIKLLEVTIPPHAIRGQNAKLNCNYDMEGDKLYSIKWYRNGHEFYRFVECQIKLY